jgi:hypothetical protein
VADQYDPNEQYEISSNPPQDSRPPPNHPSRRSATRSSRRLTDSSTGFSSYKKLAIQTAMKLHRQVVETYLGLGFYQRIAAAAVCLLTVVAVILILMYSGRIFSWLLPISKRWRELPGGWVIIWALVFCAAFPPTIGYSSIVTLSGFLYGSWNGWIVASTAAVVGSTVSFLTCRSVLSKFVHKHIGNDIRFRALSLTLKYDGLGMLTLIRWA